MDTPIYLPEYDSNSDYNIPDESILNPEKKPRTSEGEGKKRG